MAPSRLILLVSNGLRSIFCVVALMLVFGGLPNKTDIGISIGVSANNSSLRTNSCSLVDSPNTANGARSRVQMLLNISMANLICIKYL